MEGTPTNSIHLGSMESPISLFSGLSDFDTSLQPPRWKRSPEKCFNDDYEFGRIHNLEVGESFLIKFYYVGSVSDDDAPKKEVACRLDDFIEVPMSDAINCLEVIRDDRIALDSVHLEICTCDANTRREVDKVLRAFAERRERCESLSMVKRLTFFMYDISSGVFFAPIIAKIAPRAFEVNIGIANKKVRPVPPSAESTSVHDFLTAYLNPRSTWQTIRVLRIFNFVSLDKPFEKILNQCNLLRHLTLSNIDEIHSTIEFKNVTSVLLDSCDMSTSMFDLEFAKRAPRLFPNAITFGYLRCDRSVAVRAALQFASPRVDDNRKEIHFYQPERSFRKFLFEVTKSFEVVNEDKELEGEIQIKGHNDGPVITVYNKDRMYKAKISND